MTAASQSPLVARMAEAIRQVPLSISSTRRSGQNGLRNAEEVAQAAMEACRAEEMRQVLEILVYAKEMKERSGDTPAYRAKKEEGWSRARAVLAELEGRS